MSKITIFLCAVLFAAAVDATFLSTRLASAQQRVEAFVAAKIAIVEQIYEDAKNIITENSGKLEEAADDLTNTIDDDFKTIEEKLQEDINKILGGIKDANVTACDKKKEHLRNISSAVISNMTECLNNKKEAARTYIENIETAAAEVRENLFAVREESRRCGENVDSIGTALRAIACIKMAKFRGALRAASYIPSFSRNIAKLTYSLATLPASVAICKTARGIATFYRESREIIRNTKICIQQKIDEARLTPKI